jgi:Icc-related predicted phosphoesterase
MHGNLNFDVEESDILICAGDSLPYYGGGSGMAIIEQEHFIRDEFIPWLEKQPVKDVVFIAGNHDWIFELDRWSIPAFPINMHYLQDEEIEVQGLRIYGTPQQPIFCDWAFNRTPDRLEMFFEKIPEGLDILISHTAPYKIMDKVEFDNREGHFGCKILKKKIKEVKPKYVVFGHFHGQYGVEKKEHMGDITFINASLLDESYSLTEKPIYLEL